MRTLDEQSFGLLQRATVCSDKAIRSSEAASLTGRWLSIFCSSVRAILLLSVSRWYAWRALRLGRRSLRLLDRIRDVERTGMP